MILLLIFLYDSNDSIKYKKLYLKLDKYSISVYKYENSIYLF